MRTATIFNIQRFSLHDGPGIRTTVYLKGCAARCWWCHNPEAIYENNIGIAREISLDEMMVEIGKDRIFYEDSGGGVTFSGGEPLMQHEFLSSALDACIKQGHNSAIDTTGYSPLRVFAPIAEKADVILYDLKLMDEQAHIQYTGISNRLPLENLSYLSENGSGNKVWIRVPIIPGITDGDQNISAIKRFAGSLKGIKEVALLPYHKIASGKYARLGVVYKLDGLEPPSNERMQSLKREFEDYGFNARIGG